MSNVSPILSEYVNSDRQPRSNDIKLKDVKLNRYSNHNRNNGYSRGDHGQCVVFVSRLDSKTTTNKVGQFLRSKFNRSLEIEQIKAKYNTYSSFKVFAPKSMKHDLIDRYNWDDSGAIYVREFIPTHVSYNKSNY